MTKNQRWRRRRGATTRFTSAWLERIRSTTKSAMQKPDVQEKIRKPRGPLNEEHRMKLSDALAGKMPANVLGNPGAYPNVKRGDYECSKGSVYFRSMWEANYALYLDFLVSIGQIRGWEYEAEVFVFEEVKFGKRSYRPDFTVTCADGGIEYHEVKGHMNGASKTKLRRMEKYFPDVKIILVDRTAYTEIRRQVGRIVHFYDAKRGRL